MRSADPPPSSNPALPPPPQPGFARRAAEALRKAVWRSDPAQEPHNGVATVATLTDRVKKYLPSSDVQKVKDAFRFSDEAHLGQFRRSGAPYITHPLAVAEILTDWRLDGAAIQAALLHDVLEDSGVAKEKLVEKFGAVVAELVDGVSKLDKLQFSSTEQAQAENFRKMLLAMARDVRVMLIKLADRLHNMRTLDAVDAERRRRIARETLEIYAPIAHRLGLNALFRELEELSFQHLHPMRYRVLHKAVLSARGNRRELLGKILQSVRKALAESKIHAEVYGREKTLYGIYRKMAEKNLSFSEVLDIYGFRIVVDTRPELLPHARCAAWALQAGAGQVQGLHRDPEGQRLPVAAHDADRPVRHAGGVPDPDQGHAPRRRKRRGGALAVQGRRLQPFRAAVAHAPVAAVAARDPAADRRLERVPRARQGRPLPGQGLRLHAEGQDHVAAARRHGRRLRLQQSTPTSATSASAARINSEIQPLRTPLRNGDMIEIVTGPVARPNPAWLSFVRTGKARSEIRHFLRTMKFDESVELGERLLAQAARQFNLTLAEVGEAQWETVLRQAELESRNDLLADIGLGRRLAAVVARQLALGAAPENPDEESSASPRAAVPTPHGPVLIRGTEGMAVQLANCCHPIPGDAVVGHIRKGQGLAVHQAECLHAQRARRADPERWIELQWANDSAANFTVGLDVGVLNERGVLGRIAVAIAEGDSNILNVHVEDEEAQVALIHFKIQVRDRTHLARVIRSLRRVKHVVQIARPRGGARGHQDAS